MPAERGEKEFRSHNFRSLFARDFDLLSSLYRRTLLQEERPSNRNSHALLQHPVNEASRIEISRLYPAKYHLRSVLHACSSLESQPSLLGSSVLDVFISDIHSREGCLKEPAREREKSKAHARDEKEEVRSYRTRRRMR